jgi:hypothetical protein
MSIGFNKDLFLKKNQDNNENNPFGEIQNGSYICDLIDAKLCYSKEKNTLQALFQWKIDPDSNDTHKGQNIFVCIKLENDDKSVYEKGYEILDIVLKTMGVNNPQVFVEDFENNMSRLVSSRARIKVEPNKQNPQYKQNRIEKLLKNAWRDGNGQAPVQTSNGSAAYYDNKPFTNTRGENIVEGATVSVRMKDGQYSCKIMSVVGAMKQAMVSFDSGVMQPQLVPFDDIFVVSSPAGGPSQTQPVETPQTTVVETVQVIEEIPVETPVVKLEVGMNVTGAYQGEVRRGPIYKIDETQNLVYINDGGKAYPCPLDTIKVIQ